MTKRIALLTSGGDSPGMNAAIRAIVRTAIYNEIMVVGVRRGYTGLIQGDYHEMNLGSVADIIQRGGTILQTSRSEEFMTAEGRLKALQQMKAHGIEGLIAIGGDGTFRGALELSRLGIPVVGIPGTIDNDVPDTDLTIGFDTTVNTVVDCINKIRDTATSHERVFVIEVMGRHSGEIALAAGLAGGAESILIPELSVDISVVVSNIKRGMERGKRHSIIIAAEGAGSGQAIAAQIESLSGIESRYSVLGYIQRGGTPTAQDRLLASRMGAEAVQLLMKGENGKMTALQNNNLVAVSLEECLTKKKSINMGDYYLAGILSI